MSADADQIRGQAARSVMWAGLTQVLSKGSTVVATLVLARVLVPSDFGLFAVGLLVINYLDALKDAGIGAALVYRREPWDRLAPTGLPLSFVSSAVLAGLALLGAPLAADFFHEPRAEGLVRLLAICLFVSGLAVVPESRLRRGLDFRRRLVPEVATTLVKGVVSVTLAVNGFGVDSLVWGQVAGVVVQATLYWTLAGWRPEFHWDRKDARKLLKYGLSSALVAVFSVVHDNIDYLVIGHRLDTQQVGYYVLAFRIPELTVLGICLVASQVLFPVFSRLQDDREALRSAYLNAVRSVALVTFPVGALMAVAAEEIVHVLYSDGWDPSIPVLRILALYAVAYSLGYHAGDVYKATGRPGILNVIGVVKLMVLIPALWIAADHGIVWVATVLLIATIGLSALKLIVAMRMIDIESRQLLVAFVPAVVASAAMTAVVWGLGSALGDLAVAYRLVAMSLVALVSYAAAVHIVAPDISAVVVARLPRRPRLRG